MGMHLRVIHPAWATYVQARGRNPVTELVQATTEAFVPGASIRDFRHAWFQARPMSASPLLVHEDALWEEVLGYRENGSFGSIRPEDFARTLSSTPDSRGKWFEDLARTPLAGVARSRPFSGPRPAVVGRAVDLDAARAVTHDGRADAARSVQDFLASDFRVLERCVVRRWRSPAIVRTGTDRSGWHYFGLGETPEANVLLVDPPDHDWFDAFPVRPSTLDAAIDRIPKFQRRFIHGSVRAWQAIGDEMAGSRDGAWLVDAYAPLVEEVLLTEAAHLRRSGAVRQRLDAALARIGPVVRASLLGTRGEDVPDALAAMSAALSAAKVSRHEKDWNAGRAFLADWLDNFYLPDLVPEQDAEAIGALAPG